MLNFLRSGTSSRRLRAKDVICARHRRMLGFIGAGSLMDLNGRATRQALGRARAQMAACPDCQQRLLDNKDAHR